jgi:RNA polymerase sigma factor (sigma-70 family)
VKAGSVGGGGSRQRAWDQRYGRLYEDLKRPARAMVRRAFGSVFGESEIEDIYGNAWLATLRALEKRQGELSDGELRKYVLTAVANHASKELRRRGRRPTAPLDEAPEVADSHQPPDERAATLEQSRLARDVLGTLPPRRRAVLMFRYGWGLKPEEVCALIKGLSPRAYRKEITRGVSEISAKLRLVEEGRWCGDREPVLKAFAAGIATPNQKREAEQHLAHCRHCTRYVATLSGQLRDLGSAIAWTGAVEVFGHCGSPVVDRAADLIDRARETALGFVHRGGDTVDAAGSQLAAAGGTRGAGGAAIYKLVAICASTAGAGAAGVTAGVIPALEVPGHGLDRSSAAERAASDLHEVRTHLPIVVPPANSQSTPDEVTDPAGGTGPDKQAPPVQSQPPAAPAVEPSPAPPQQEFAPAAGAPVPSSNTPNSSVGAGTGSAAAQEFGP